MKQSNEEEEEEKINGFYMVLELRMIMALDHWVQQVDYCIVDPVPWPQVVREPPPGSCQVIVRMHVESRYVRLSLSDSPTTLTYRNTKWVR